MKQICKVAAIIPALNEGRRIEALVKELLRVNKISQVVVGDNASSDDTASKALLAGADVAYAPIPGYGSACLAALELVREDIDALLFINADGAEVVSEATGLIEGLSSADLVIGSRTLGAIEPGALLPQQLLGNRLACFLIKLFWQQHFTDLGPFRAISYEAYKRLELSDKDFGWIIEMQLKAVLKNYSIREIPVTTRCSEDASKISGTLKGFFMASYKILGAIAYYGLKGRFVPNKNTSELKHV